MLVTLGLKLKTEREVRRAKLLLISRLRLSPLEWGDVLWTDAGILTYFMAQVEEPHRLS